MNQEDLLLSAAKPSRYLGTEVNARRKGAEAKLRFALAFPDAYEVGMSHLGIQILYSLLNSLPDVAAERCFAPWPDMEQLLRKHKLPLVSLETQRPLSAFDMVGFSLQYELSYTNVLAMLELGGIPIRRENRGEGSPLVIAGGPCAFNPAPMSDFIDAFVIGEGEEAVLEIAAAALRAKGKKLSRNKTLEALAEIEGVYAPAIHKRGEKIRKRIVADLNGWCVPTSPVVPLMKTVHDRIALEIARGCTRGCRFCQAGMVWRPVRERRQDVLEKMADSLLCATGYDEISLLSLSSGDYSRIEPLLTALMERYYEKRVALALPSLRVETLTRNLMENIRRVRKTSFTLAPEAGTQRLRDVINKGNSSAELLSSTRQVFEAGWKSVKLYFMIGLPSERREDLEGIVELAYQVLSQGEKRGQVTVSLSTFVPKPHTPFQWQKQISMEEIREKQAFLKDRMRNRNLSVKWHDGRMSLLEGILSRENEKTGRLVEEAFRLGCRFDGWADMLRYDLWEEAISRTGVNIGDCLRERSLSEELPWDMIDCGVKNSFLIAEVKKAGAGETTPDCRFTDCQACGVCDYETIKVITAAPSAPALSPKEDGQGYIKPAAPAFPASGSRSAAKGEKYRIKFVKMGKAGFLSHLEVSEALIRAVKRSGVSFVYSQGYHPHPKISFASATSVGMESMEEYAEIQINALGDDSETMLMVNAFLPSGLELVEMEHIKIPKESLSESVKGFVYAINLPPDMAHNLPEVKEKMERFLKSDSFVIIRDIKGKGVEKNIRAFVSALSLDEERHVVALSVRIGNEGTARPMEILTKVLGISEDKARTMRIVRTETCLESL